MIDNADSTTRVGRSWRRERALRATRRRLARLEIETHWIKAELARLESENESALAVELTHELGLEGAAAPRPIEREAAAPRTRSSAARVDFSAGRHARIHERREIVPQGVAVECATASASARQPAIRKMIRTVGKRRKKSSPAWLASVGVHLAVLLLLAPMSYVMMTNEPMPLFASMFEVESPNLDESGAAPIELVSFESFEVPADELSDAAALAENFTEEFSPVESEWNSESTANLGQLNTLPTDVGTLMAGGGRGEDRAAGSRGGGRGAAGDEARLGLTNFFGTPARANRVVFLVDNSGSMKQGRMETTLFELARSVESLGEKQEFYVVFYSDQAYPMLYPASVMTPLAATRENKQRLYAWLQTVELCSGGALLKAIELAESLEPHVVYILSDGDISGTKTMERLTQPNSRKFAIHTLGMGVKKPQDAQNLLAIAEANHGTFQMVRPLPAAVQMAKARPIRSNSFGVAWGAGTAPLSR
jgi:von Willebrand factor type A domain